jgi:protocatechuate 3,4-dioxygenase beta subunit
MQNLRIELSRFGVLAGTIRDSDGDPLEGIEVDIWRMPQAA